MSHVKHFTCNNFIITIELDELYELSRNILFNFIFVYLYICIYIFETCNICDMWYLRHVIFLLLLLNWILEKFSINIKYTGSLVKYWLVTCKMSHVMFLSLPLTCFYMSFPNRNETLGLCYNCLQLNIYDMWLVTHMI